MQPPDRQGHTALRQYDKRAFVQDYFAERAIPLSRCFAVGDSHSDIPMFQVVGFSIALNASPEAQAAATLKVNSDSLIVISQLIPGFIVLPPQPSNVRQR